MVILVSCDANLYPRGWVLAIPGLSLLAKMRKISVTQESLLLEGV